MQEIREQAPFLGPYIKLEMAYCTSNSEVERTVLLVLS